MGSGDAISQLVVERKTFDTYQWRRTVRFFGLGAFLVVSFVLVTGSFIIY